MNVLRLERLVARTVFWRFFESGLVPPGVSLTLVLIWVVAFLATPGYLMAFGFGISFGGSEPVTLLERLLAPTLLLIVFSMAAMGFFALLMWEGAYPDRRDARTFGAIGLRNRTLVLGRLGALATVAAITSVGMNAPSSAVFGLVLWEYGAASGVAQAVLGHFVATVCSGLFVFFLVLTAQGGLLSLVGLKIAQRLALLLQVAIVVCLFEAIQLVPDTAAQMRLAFEGGASPPVSAFPPTWFLALHSTLVGRPSSPPLHFTWWATGSTALVVLLTVCFSAATHRSMARIALETTGARRSKDRLVDRILDGVVFCGARTSARRAIAAFTVCTLTRSRPHLLVFATFTGIALALTSASALVILGPGHAPLSPLPPVSLLSVPLVLNFIWLCGGRMLLGLPLDARANWVFRFLADTRRSHELVDGARTVLVVLVVLPVAVVAAISVSQWGLLVSVGHALFTAGAGALLVDALMFRFRKIPFTSAYRPGGARIGTLWPAYFVAFSLYCYSLANVEAWLLSRPFAWCLFIGGSFATSRLLARLRRSDLAPPRQLDYDAPDPEHAFQGFGFSEALAAQAVHGQHPPRP